MKHDSHFVKGMELCRAFFEREARPILKRAFPSLPYSAGLLGYGSDVLGYDDMVSTDHMWGPRFYLFLRKEDLSRRQEVEDAFAHGFPCEFFGYSVHFTPGDPQDQGVRHPKKITSGPVSSLVEVLCFEDYLKQYLGTADLEHLSALQWLSFSEHRLLGLTAGAFFEDQLKLKERISQLGYYPQDVRLYLIASQWNALGEEEAFMRRCASCGDDVGSILVAARMVERLMRLCFLYCGMYAPYSKWFGTAFSRLPLSEEFRQAAGLVLTADAAEKREQGLVEFLSLVGGLHNTSGLCAPVPVHIQPYFGRNIQVIYAGRFAEAAQQAIRDSSLRQLPQIGSFSQMVPLTQLADEPAYSGKIQAFYRMISPGEPESSLDGGGESH